MVATRCNRYDRGMFEQLNKLITRAFSAVAIIAAGIVAWAIALVLVIAVGGKSDYIWICVMGIALGLIGLRYTIRRAKRELVKNFY